MFYGGNAAINQPGSHRWNGILESSLIGLPATGKLLPLLPIGTLHANRFSGKYEAHHGGAIGVLVADAVGDLACTVLAVPVMSCRRDGHHAAAAATLEMIECHISGYGADTRGKARAIGSQSRKHSNAPCMRGIKRAAHHHTASCLSHLHRRPCYSHISEQEILICHWIRAW